VHRPDAPGFGVWCDVNDFDGVVGRLVLGEQLFPLPLDVCEPIFRFDFFLLSFPFPDF